MSEAGSTIPMWQMIKNKTCKKLTARKKLQENMPTFGDMGHTTVICKNKFD